MTKSPLQSLLGELRTDVEHLVATCVVDIDSGMPLAGVHDDPSFDSIAAAASYAQVVKANVNALRFLGLDPASTEDIVITTHDRYILIRLLGTTHYHGVTVRKQASLGLTRTLMGRYAPKLLAAIPK